MEQEGKREHSTFTMFLLFTEGCFFLLVSAAVLACGFVLNFHDNFDSDFVDAQMNYTQYWVGITFLITAFVAIAAGAGQRRRWLVLSALLLFFLCVLVSLFSLVVDGNNWVNHKYDRGRKSFWEGMDYKCQSISSTCICSKAQDMKIISPAVDCNMLGRLSNLYGGIVCCVLVGIFLALSSIIIVIIFIPFQPFTIPEHKKKIKKITVLEDRERTPSPRIIYQPKKVEEPEIEEIVVREAKPRRQRTIIYDEPIPQHQRSLVPIEPPRGREPPVQIVHIDGGERHQTGKMISHVYDEGRLVTQPRPRPPVDPEPMHTGRNFVVNPNFRNDPTNERVEYRDVDRPPAQAIVRRERPPYVEEPVLRGRPVAYEMRRMEPVVHKIPVVYEKRKTVPVVRRRPIAYEERRPLPVQNWSYVHREKRPSRYVVERPPRRSYTVEDPRRMYPVEPPREYRREASRAVVRRTRSFSDEGPRLFQEARPGGYMAERSHAHIRQMPPEVVQGRPRANSDERVRLYSGAKPRIFTEELPATTQVMAGQAPKPDQQAYDKRLEDALPTGDKLDARPSTPY